MNPPTPQSPEYPGQNAMKLVHPFSPHNCPPSYAPTGRSAHSWYSPAASISPSSLPPDKQLEIRARRDGGWHFYNQDRHGPDK